jgi:hypothetical protein
MRYNWLHPYFTSLPFQGACLSFFYGASIFILSSINNLEINISFIRLNLRQVIVVMVIIQFQNGTVFLQKNEPNGWQKSNGN